MRRRIEALGALAGMVRDRDLAALAVAAREVSLIETRLADLAREIAARAATLAELPPDDVALVAGADAKWQAHLDRQRASLRHDLALALARRESAKAVARRALGRADVLDRLSRC